MTSSDKFKYESIQDRQSIKEYVHSLLEGIVEGRIVVSSNDEKVILHPTDLLNLEIKARRKKDISKLSIKISWKEETPVTDEKPQEVDTEEVQ